MRSRKSKFYNKRKLKANEVPDNSALAKFMKEVIAYNKEHGTKYSYGEYKSKLQFNQL